MKPSKIKMELQKMIFEIPAECLRTTSYKDEPPTKYIDINRVVVASIMKQYMKMKYPQVVCSVSSDSFANGNSVSVYISTPTGGEVEDTIYRTVSEFSDQFQEGRFDGMYDIYEYSDDTMTTDNGTPIKGGTKYISVQNRAKFGTVADTVRMLRDMMAGKYVYGIIDMSTAIEKTKGFGITQSNLDKALKLI
jgi:hypothetical protein